MNEVGPGDTEESQELVFGRPVLDGEAVCFSNEEWPYYDSMVGKFRKYLNVSVCVMYVFTALFLELGHTDIVDTTCATVHRLLSHDCSTNEFHHPLGVDDQCPACARMVQSTGYIHAEQFLPGPSIEFIAGLKIPNSVPQTDGASLVVRGPPALSL